MSTLDFRFERKGFSLTATAPLEPIVAGMPNSRRFLFGDYSIALDHTVFGTAESGPDSLRVLELQLTTIWSQPRPLSVAGLSESECFWYLASLQEFETAEMDDEVAQRRWTMGESHRLLPGCPAFDGHKAFFADDASGTRVFWLERREGQSTATVRAVHLDEGTLAEAAAEFAAWFRACDAAWVRQFGPAMG